MPKQRYIVIGGFASTDGPGTPKTILLYEGNYKSEGPIQTLEHFPADTPYDVVSKRASVLAAEMSVKLGRDFTREEWGP